MPDREPQFFFEREAIGTHWYIESTRPISGLTQAKVDARIDEFDVTYSRFRSDSLVSAARKTPGRYQFPPDAADLFALYDTLDRLTDGAVNPLVGEGLEALGYDAEYRLTQDRTRAPHAAPSWQQSVHRDGTVITTTPQTGLIDVGAAGKGYLVEIVSALLRAEGHDDTIVDAGGDIVATGAPKVIGLENPFDSHQAVGTIEIQNAAVCASGINRRSWGVGLHHVVDARTGVPTSGVVATWAVAERGLVADGLATALFFADPVILEGAFDFTWVRVFADGTLTYSSGLRGQIFERDDS